VGPIYGSHPIGLLYFIWNPGFWTHTCKVGLSINDVIWYRKEVKQEIKFGGKGEGMHIAREFYK
jgi:hypothetical protein